MMTKTELFIDLAEPNKEGVSRWVQVSEFVDKYKDKCITILLKRCDRDVPNNDSDKNVSNFNYNYLIENSGNKKDLEKEALNFLKKITKQ